MSDPIITKLTDSDMYKITMQQVVFNQYPSAHGRYSFVCRNQDVDLGFLANSIGEQVDMMGDIKITDEEVNFLSNKPYIQDDYLEYLANYRYNPEHVVIQQFEGKLDVQVLGPWKEAILWEVPLLSVINELYFKATTDLNKIEEEGKNRLQEKITMLAPYVKLFFAEFGTRRRYSFEWQKYVLEELLYNLPTQCIGTSNMWLANHFGCEAIGTMAHEYISAHLALVDRISVAQKRALHVWLQEYGGTHLGIALSDTFTVNAFLNDFEEVLANTYKGVRHDSGDPFEFGDNVIKHYEILGIDPKTKTIVFSDGLDIPSTIKLYLYFEGRIGVSFGIGTNFSNDLGPMPLNIVMKLVMLNGKPIVKLSDVISKAIGDPDMIEKVKKAYHIL